MIYVYKISNILNNKIYIGQTKRLNKRFKEHVIYKKFSLLSKAIKKYGINNFSFEIITKTKFQQTANLLEEYFIIIYNTLTPKGYNVLLGANGNRFSIEKREELSQIHKGKKLTDEHKKNISLGNSIPKSENHKRAMSLSRLGKSHKCKNNWRKKPIKGINKITKEIVLFESILSTKNFGFEPKNVSKVINKKMITHKGYYWELYNE